MAWSWRPFDWRPVEGGEGLARAQSVPPLGVPLMALKMPSESERGLLAPSSTGVICGGTQGEQI